MQPLTPIHCVAFDAVGTLIHAAPAVSEVYACVAQQFGITVSISEVRQRFRSAMGQRAGTLQTSESLEYAFWRDVVQEVIGDRSLAQDCFQILYDHFAQPKAWRVDDQASWVLDELLQRGVRLAVASNFDGRLHKVLDGLFPSGTFAVRVISSEVGWKKPSPHFYEHLLAELELPAESVCMVGDDSENDVRAARRHGLAAMLVNADHPESRSLNEVLKLVQ